MKQILFSVILCVVFFMPCVAQDVSGKVRGTVSDPQKSVIPGTIITFQNKKFRKQVEANEEGKYEVELPAGSYVVTINDGRGFLKYRRKHFKVTTDKIVNLDITLIGKVPDYSDCPAGQLCL